MLYEVNLEIYDVVLYTYFCYLYISIHKLLGSYINLNII
jgi:hypothetical protein